LGFHFYTVATLDIVSYIYYSGHRFVRQVSRLISQQRTFLHAALCKI